MQVALAIERMESWRGGAETSTLQLASALRDAGAVVHLITASRGQPIPGTELHMLPGGPFGKTWSTRQFVRRAARLAGELGVDVLHAVSPLPGANLYQPRGGTVPETVERNLALVPAGRRGLKRVLNVFNGRQQLLARLERRMLRAGRGGRPVVAALSGYVASQLERHYGLSGSEVELIFNGVDLESLDVADGAGARRQIREEYSLGDASLVLLMIAHNFRLKGVATAVRALGQLRSHAVLSGAHLLVVGRDNPVPVLALAESLGVAERVHVLGSSQRVPVLLRAADVLVHPTFYDPCSRVVLEAAACGVVSITTRFNGAADVLEHGRSGWIIPDGDSVAELAEGLSVLSDAERRREAGRACLELRERVSMRRHVEGLLGLYARIAREGPALSQTLGAAGIRV